MAIGLAALAGIALKIGAPILASILKGKGGGGAIAGQVIEAAAKQLGVEPTEEAIAAEFEREPERTAEVLQTIDADLGVMATAAADAVKSYHGLLTGDRESQSLLNRIWRPVNGFLFGLEVATIVFVVSMKIWEGDVATLNALQPLYAFLGTILGTHAGVVGVYVWRRSDEKLKRTA